MANTTTGSYFTPDTASYETLRKISALNLKAFTKLAGLQFELATLGIETSVARAKLLTRTKDYDQLFTHESRIANQYGTRIFEISKETTDLLIKSGDELNTIIGGIFTAAKDGMAVTVAAVSEKPVVKTAAKQSVTKKPVKRKTTKK